MSENFYANKYEMEEFEFGGRYSTVIKPENPRADKAYIWRTEFLGAFDYCDKEMLERGFYLVYHKVSDMYGCDESLEYLHAFHLEIIEKYGFPKEAILFGFSRGGLYAFNYAVKYPEYARLLYLDAPVLCVRSWPGGYGASPRYEKEWEECKACYKLTDESALDFKGNPLDKIDMINIPIILVAGLVDKVVPYAENGKILSENYKGKIKTIVKPDCDHHPHSLSDPMEIADFIEENI